MLKTFLASTAVVTTLGCAALAQEAGDPMPKQPGTETQAPAEIAPAAPATEAQSVEPASPTPSTDTAQDPAAPGAMAPSAGAEQVLTPVIAADIPVDGLKGADIQTRDGQTVAEIEDMLMSPDGKIENVVAQFGGFLGFGGNKVLLSPDEIEVFQDQSGTYVVQTDLTPDALEGRPEYQAEQ